MLLCAVCLTLACASYQRVHFESSPAGAEVFLDGESMGVTPLELRVARDAHHKVFLKLDGYRSQLVVLEQHRPQDRIDFLTPADVRVRLVPSTGPGDRDLEVEVEPQP